MLLFCVINSISLFADNNELLHCFAALHCIGMKYKNDKDKEEMLEWEKVSAIEHVRKANNAKQQNLDNRVIVIEDRYLPFSPDINNCGYTTCFGDIFTVGFLVINANEVIKMFCRLSRFVLQ